MNRRLIPSTRMIASGGTLLAFVLALSLASPPSARAGIGNPLKKAKEKLARKATPEPEGEGIIDNDTVVFDDVTLELTGGRLDGVLAGCRAAQAAEKERGPIVARLNKENQERSAFWEKNGEAIMDLERKRDELNVCYQDGYRDAQERKSEEYAQRALTDPALIDKFARAAAEQNAAAARGDSAAIRKINETIFSETLISREDSLAVQKKCGAMPPRTPAEVKLADMDRQIAADNEALRSLDAKYSQEQARQLDMTNEQYGVATDRILAYLAWKRQHPKDPPPGFSEEEKKALDERQDDLRACFG